MAPDDTLWPISPHTACKHEILRRYLGGWYPKLSSKPGRTILYVDGFAGPGRYRGGEPGSPIIALQAIASHPVKRDSGVRFLFVENNEQRYHHLCGEIEAISSKFPPNFVVETKLGAFDETLSGILDLVDTQNRLLSPTFAFIDPFGFAGTPIRLIARIMANPKCEVMVNFAYDSVNRFGHEEQNRKHVTELFGTAEWEQVVSLSDPDARRHFLHGLYVRQLKKVGNASYVLSFEMRDQFNQTEYYLDYGTNSVEGIRVMKYAMWTQDTSGQYKFSDYTDYGMGQGQPMLLSAPDPLHIGDLLVRQYAHRQTSSDRIREYLLVNTPFRETHANDALNALLKRDQGTFTVLNPENVKRRGTYPPGTILKFR